MLAKARTHAQVLARLGFDGADRFTTDNATEIAWQSGGRIIALPANKRTARSFTGDVWLDEFAYHIDPEGIRDGAFPIATRGDWRVRVFSTPNGSQGLFHQWATSPPDGWALHRVSVDDAITQGLALDRAVLRQLTGGDERLYRQWYGCEFTDADQQYLPSVWLDRALAWSGDAPALDDPDVAIHAGFDVGRVRDLSVLVLVAVHRRVAWVLAVLTWPRTRFADQRKGLAKAREIYQWESLHIDETGLGAQLAEELAEEWGEDEVKRVRFTPLVKEQLATRAYRFLSADRLRLPRNREGRLLRDEGAAVRRVVSAAGHVLYEAPRTSEGHGDRWTALTLALAGCGEPSTIRLVNDGPVLAIA